jgi:CheY-like chemotaxis protein
MKIDYNILWFEDIKESFNTKKTFVKDIVEELGFTFPEPRNEINGENINAINFAEYDLIIVDLNLSKKEKGPELMEKIRQMDVYTEVVFYSSDGEDAVRAALRDHQIDGAYCAGRANEDFEDKVRKVIKTTIKKVQDINNMRGLIMAETSDIDSIMLDIISFVLEKNINGAKDSLSNLIFENVNAKVTTKKTDFDKFHKNKNINRVIKDSVMFDASQKIIALQFIIDAIDSEITNPQKNNIFATNYTEIKQKRDLLAHVIEEYEDGVKKLKSGGRELEFTDDFCTDMRKKVKHHNKNLEDLYNLIIKL